MYCIRLSALNSKSRNSCFVKHGKMRTKADVLEGMSSHIFCAKIIDTVQIALQFCIVSAIEPMDAIRFVYIKAMMLHSVGYRVRSLM